MTITWSGIRKFHSKGAARLRGCRRMLNCRVVGGGEGSQIRRVDANGSEELGNVVAGRVNETINSEGDIGVDEMLDKSDERGTNAQFLNNILQTNVNGGGGVVRDTREWDFGGDK